MRKVVRVDEMIKTARYELECAKRYSNEGKYDLAKDTYKRVEAMTTLISITAINDMNNWDDEWNDIYNRIYE